MTSSVPAIYEKGLFRPTKPVALSEGAIVQVVFESVAPLLPPQPLVEALLAIAQLPSESANDGFSGADHDKILYGDRGAW